MPPHPLPPSPLPPPHHHQDHHKLKLKRDDQESVRNLQLRDADSAQVRVCVCALACFLATWLRPHLPSSFPSEAAAHDIRGSGVAAAAPHGQTEVTALPEAQQQQRQPVRSFPVNVSTSCRPLKALLQLEFTGLMKVEFESKPTSCHIDTCSGGQGCHTVLNSHDPGAGLIVKLCTWGCGFLGPALCLQVEAINKLH